MTTSAHRPADGEQRIGLTALESIAREWGWSTSINVASASYLLRLACSNFLPDSAR